MKQIALALLLSIGISSSFPLALHIIDEEDDKRTIDLTEYTHPFVPDMIDTTKVTELIEQVTNDTSVAPMNAYMNDTNEIIEGVPGKILDKEMFRYYVYQTFYAGKTVTIPLPMKQIYPNITSELLSEISVQKLGSYTTFFNEMNEERANNIQLSTAAINNQVVFPGETFSFNERVGERTIERGYEKAPVIVKGEFSEDIGGGICQVSSTLFNAVRLKGIQIVERYSHSREVPYVPPGKDAAVSWWGPDFVFKNKYNAPILIRGKAENGIVQLAIYSSDSVQYKK